MPAITSKKQMLAALAAQGADYAPKNHKPAPVMRAELEAAFPGNVTETDKAFYMPDNRFLMKDTRPAACAVGIKLRSKDFFIIYPDGREILCDTSSFTLTASGLESARTVLSLPAVKG